MKQQYLLKLGAGGEYRPGIGQPGKILWPPNPTRVAVIEELIHLGQDKYLDQAARSWKDVHTWLEIDAQFKLLELSKHIGFSPREIQAIGWRLTVELDKVALYIRNGKIFRS